MTQALKEAGLQTPELTNRNCIRATEWWVSKHNFPKPLANKRLGVDAAGLGAKDKRLTWGGLGIDLVSMSQGVSRGHSSWW